MIKNAWRNIGRMVNLSDASPTYCWSRLFSIADAHNGKRLSGEDAFVLKDDARSTATCKRDAEENGSCYCGKIVKVGGTP